MADERIPVAVLGATGSVGQRFVQLLARHPWFRVAELVASERSAGKRYREATDWRLDNLEPLTREITLTETPAAVADMLAGKAVGRTLVRPVR